MAEINIKSLPLVTTPSDDDVLVINVGNEITSGITYGNLKTTNLGIGYFDDGTVAEPSITFTTATDTGLYRSGNDTDNGVSITSNGLNCLRAEDGFVSFNSTEKAVFAIDCYGDIVSRLGARKLGFRGDIDTNMLSLVASNQFSIIVNEVEKGRFTNRFIKRFPYRFIIIY